MADEGFDDLFTTTTVEVVQSFTTGRLKAILTSLKDGLAEIQSRPSGEDFSKLLDEVASLKEDVHSLQLQVEALETRQEETVHPSTSQVLALLALRRRHFAGLCTGIQSCGT